MCDPGLNGPLKSLFNDYRPPTRAQDVRGVRTSHFHSDHRGDIYKIDLWKKQREILFRDSPVKLLAINIMTAYICS